MSVRNKFIQASIRAALEGTRVKQSQQSSFSSSVADGALRSTGSGMQGVAAPFIPGGSVVGAAISGAGQIKGGTGGLGVVCQEISEGVGDVQKAIRTRLGHARVDPQVQADLEFARRKLQDAAARLKKTGM